MAIGYGAIKREGPRDKVNLFDTKGVKAAAGFTSNVEDLARFAVMAIQVAKQWWYEILKSSTLKEMHRVQWVDPDWKTYWGLASVFRNQTASLIVGHGGSCPVTELHCNWILKKKWLTPL